MPLHRDDLLARTRSVGPAAGTYQLPAAELAKLAGSSPVLGISGVVWSTVRSAADNAWTSLCWSPQRELLVAASSSGTGNRIITSADGLSWTVPNSPADLGWRSLCWSTQRRQFAAVSNSGTSNRVMVSP